MVSTRANSKTCSKCKVSIPLTEFSKDSKAADGLRRYCKECAKKCDKERSAERKRKLESGELKYPSEKKCSKCNLTKKKEEFRLNSRNSDGLNSYCTRCQSLYHIRSKYGLNEEEYLAMHENQKGECEICKEEILLFLKGIDVRAAHVDHAHVQGFKKMKAEDKKKHVRGMLCRNCNLMVGYAKDNPKMLRAAAHYLEEFARID